MTLYILDACALIADTFALATTSVNNGVLLTADHHEMDKIEQCEPEIKFRWIR